MGAQFCALLPAQPFRSGTSATAGPPTRECVHSYPAARSERARLGFSLDSLRWHSTVWWWLGGVTVAKVVIVV